MPKIHVTKPQYGTGTGEQIQATFSVPIEMPAAGTTGQQLWMITGSGKWDGTGPAQIEADVSTTFGGTATPHGTLRVWTNSAPNHCTFPVLYFTTTYGSGPAQVTIQGVGPQSQWDSNDTLQVTMIEMDHSGFGGGR